MFALGSVMMPRAVECSHCSYCDSASRKASHDVHLEGGTSYHKVSGSQPRCAGASILWVG